MPRRTLARTLAALALLTPATASAVRPDRVWGTYYGGAGSDAILAMAHDGAGNLYVAGQTGSVSAIATPGTEQTVHGGGTSDAFLVKFTPDGERVWGTYLGGPGGEGAAGLVVDGTGAPILTGDTSSSTGIATPGSLQTIQAGSVDMFVVKFGADGKRVWGTYIGGALSDAGAGLAVDADDNIYAAGNSYGALSFALPGPHDTSPNGTEDIVLLKLAPNGAMVWGTYFGGNSSEVRPRLQLAGDAVYVLASALSEGLATDDAYDKLCGAGDAILARFDADGLLQFSTYVGGDKQEVPQGLAIAPDGDIVVIGFTTSTSGIATPGAHQMVHGGGGYDGFVVRLDPTGAPRWGTYLGGGANDLLNGVALDPAGNLMLAGQTSSAGLATPDAYQTVLAGGQDALIAKFDPTGAVRYVSYLGGAVPDLGTSIRLVPGSVDGFYLAGMAVSTAGIATPGAHQTVNGGTADGMLVRFTQGQGDACAADSDCEAGFCTDGVCCDSPCGGDEVDCQVCSAALGAVADGTCTVQSADATCRPAADECDAAEQCTGDDPACPPDLSVIDGEPCQDGLCAAGLCVPLGDPGAPCQDDLACASGFCVDGVCCDSACGDSVADDCQACSLTAGAAVDGSCGALVDESPCADGVCLAGTCSPDPMPGTSDSGTSDSGTSTGGVPTTSDATTDPTPTGADSNHDSTSTDSLPTGDSGPASESSGAESGEGEGADTAGVNDGGCGCRSPASGGLPLALLVLLARPRRPRRRDVNR